MNHKGTERTPRAEGVFLINPRAGRPCYVMIDRRPPTCSFRRTIAAGCFLLALCASAAPLLAHAADENDEVPHHFHDLWTTWGWEPGSIIALALSAWLYARGLRRTWRASGYGRAIKPWEA